MIYGVFYNGTDDLTLVGVYTGVESAKDCIVKKVAEEEYKKDEELLQKKEQRKKDFDIVQKQIEMVNAMDDCEEKNLLLDYLDKRLHEATVCWGFIKDAAPEEKDYIYYYNNLRKYMLRYGYNIYELEENTEVNIEYTDVFNGSVFDV